MKRRQIADALQAVAGIEAYETPPPVIHAFDAWPQLQLLRAITLGPCLVESDWWVFVALPAGDLTETIETADELWLRIFEVLNQIGSANEAAPDRITTAEADGGQPVMRFVFISD